MGKKFTYEQNNTESTRGTKKGHNSVNTEFQSPK